jgi:bifunctional non-homologous end joining protein LigD
LIVVPEWAQPSATAAASAQTIAQAVVAGTDIQYSESFEVDDPDMFKHVCKTGLEGVVSKVHDSRYSQGRSNDWITITCRQRETLPIAGFALKANKFDGIFIGRRRGDELIYAGKVDDGFTRHEAIELQTGLKPLIRKSQPYKKRIAHKGVWVSQRCWPKLSTARSRRQENCGIHFSKDCERICR